MSGSTRRADVDEIFSLVITVKKIRHQGRVSWRAGAEIEVEKPIIVHVSEIRSHRRNRSVETGLTCDIDKGPIAVVAIKLVWCVLVSDVEIDPAIIVVISPAGGMSRVVHTQKTTLEGHVSEGAVAVIAQKRVTHRPFPSPAHYVDVEPTIVVKV